MPTPTKGPRLGGSPAHQKRMLANLATELFRHGKIQTTETKAKRLRPLAEHLITKAKRGDLHAARRAFIELVEKLQAAPTTAPARKSPRKAASQQDKVEALAREDEAPAATPAKATTDADTGADDQDAEPPESASGDKGAEGPGDQAEGEDEDEK